MLSQKSHRSLLLAAEVTIGTGLVAICLAFYFWGVGALSDDPARQHRRMAVEAIAAQDFEAAAVEYRKAAELDPQNAVIRYELGVVYNELGHLNEAVAAWSEALRIDPSLEQASGALRELESRRIDLGNTNVDPARLPAPAAAQAVRDLSAGSLR